MGRVWVSGIVENVVPWGVLYTTDSQYLGNGSLIADVSGNIDLTQDWYTLPSNTKALVLAVEVGYPSPPSEPECVQCRIMPYGYNDYDNYLDAGKVTFRTGVSNIDINAQAQIEVPIIDGVLQFYFALQSTDSTVANKFLIIDLWAYDVPD